MLIKAWNAKEQWHPMGHPNDSLKTPPLIINKGKGVHIEDLDGKRYVDGVGGYLDIIHILANLVNLTLGKDFC